MDDNVKSPRLKLLAHGGLNYWVRPQAAVIAYDVRIRAAQP